MIHTIVHREDRFEIVGDHSSISEYLLDPATVLWVDIEDPQAEDMTALRDEFQFHPLSLEDVITAHERPKIEVFPTYYFLVAVAVSWSEGDERVVSQEVGIFAGKNYLVTVHKKPMPQLMRVLDQWQRNEHFMRSDIGTLLYMILDTLVDEYFPVIDAVADRVDELEDKVFEKFDRSALEDIFQLKRNLLGMRRIIAPERDVLNVLLRRDPPILPADASVYFQDIYDHLLRILDSIDTYRDLLSSALDAYLSVQGNQLNEIVRRLTIISVVFLPLTFITGFFGMNFPNAIHWDSPATFVFAILCMVLAPTLMLLYFHRRGWS
ncbi:MAG: magnesium/cobalt transporter CorA [Anaerolineae bacterium]